MQDQIEKVRKAFANYQSKYIDDDLLTLYLMLKNEIKYKEQNMRTIANLSKTSKKKGGKKSAIVKSERESQVTVYSGPPAQSFI